MKTIVRLFVKLTGVLPSLLFFKPRVLREERRHYISKGVLIISNHKSLMDFPFWMLIFWNRAVKTLIAEVLYSKSAVFSWFLNCLGGIKVDRVSGNMGFVEKTINDLDRNKAVLVFPEGQLPRKGEMGLFRPSAAYIALKSGAKLLPVYTNGCYAPLKRTCCVIGSETDAVKLAGLTGEESESEAVDKLNVALKKEIERLGEMCR